MALTRSTAPLVWLDAEMTGLSPTTDTILSVSCFITSSDLTLLDPTGYHAIIQHTSTQLSAMSPWCIQTHGASGLTQLCLTSPSAITTEEAATNLLSYIQQYIPEPRQALLAGNSIHADASFLRQPPWEKVMNHLHYRLFDVSSMKEMVRRWCRPEVLALAPVKELRHTAREDVEESLEEARFYKRLLEGVVVGGDGGKRGEEDEGKGKEEEQDGGGEGDGGSVVDVVKKRVLGLTQSGTKQEDGDEGNLVDKKDQGISVDAESGGGFRTDVP